MAGRAPHKPLMLLLALGRVGLGPNSRLIPYKTADRSFRELWREFGRPGKQPRAYYPFGRLRNDDGLWEIPEESQLSTGPARAPASHPCAPPSGPSRGRADTGLPFDERRPTKKHLFVVVTQVGVGIDIVPIRHQRRVVTCR